MKKKEENGGKVVGSTKIDKEKCTILGNVKNEWNFPKNKVLRNEGTEGVI